MQFETIFSDIAYW